MAEPRRGLLGRLFGGAAETAPENDSPANDVPVVVAEAVIVPPPSPPASAIPQESASSGSWWTRLKSGLARSTQSLTSGISDVFTKRKLDAESLEDLEDLLLKADLGTATAARVVEALSRQRLEKEITPEEVRRVLAGEVEKALAPAGYSA